MTTKSLAEQIMENRTDLATRLLSGEPIRPETMANWVEQHWLLEDLKWFVMHPKRSFRLRALRVGDNKYISYRPTHVLLRRQIYGGLGKSLITLENAQDSWRCKDAVLATLWGLRHSKDPTLHSTEFDLRAVIQLHSSANSKGVLPASGETK